MTHPYDDLADRAFWRSAVAETPPGALQGIFTPKFPLDRSAAIATAGSCFAQHIGRALRRAKLNVLDVEPGPVGAPQRVVQAYGYGMYSARYGNIYTTRQLVQLIRDAKTGHVDPAEFWTREGRWYDALRPTVEPGGIGALAEAMALRKAHLAAVLRLLKRSSHFVFTLGLTECWADRATGRVWPTCPGVVAGEFDPARHEFLNLGWRDVMADLAQVRGLLQGLHPGMKMILTVSPVPLTATASGGHVLPATSRSKAVLLAAANEFAAGHEDVDYFPSYEIVTNPAALSGYFAQNLREVTQLGVDTVIATFLGAHGIDAPTPPPLDLDALSSSVAAEDVVCEEILLEAMRK